MKDQVLKLLENVHEAKDLIAINDMLNLTTAEELKELSDTLAAIDYTRIVLGISEDEFNYLRMIKAARQFARQHITDGDYSNLIDFLQVQPYGTDKTATSTIDHYPELPQYVKDLIEEFSKE